MLQLNDEACRIIDLARYFSAQFNVWRFEPRSSETVAPRINLILSLRQAGLNHAVERGSSEDIEIREIESVTGRGSHEIWR